MEPGNIPRGGRVISGVPLAGGYYEAQSPCSRIGDDRLRFAHANAQTVIEERRDPAVMIEHDRPSVNVKERGVVGEKKVIKRATTGMGDCTSKTVHKEDDIGSKTVHKTNCD